MDKIGMLNSRWLLKYLRGNTLLYLDNLTTFTLLILDKTGFLNAQYTNLIKHETLFAAEQSWFLLIINLHAVILSYTMVHPSPLDFYDVNLTTFMWLNSTRLDVYCPQIGHKQCDNFYIVNLKKKILDKFYLDKLTTFTLLIFTTFT